MSLEFNVPASTTEPPPTSPQAAAPPQPAPAAPPAPPAVPAVPAVPAISAPEAAPQEPEAPPARATAEVERGTGQVSLPPPTTPTSTPPHPPRTSTLNLHSHPTLPLPLTPYPSPLTLYPTQAAAQDVASTVKVPVLYSKSALSEIYAQKTEAPWMKRASSDKYSVRQGRAAPCRTASPCRRTAALPRAAPPCAAAAPPCGSRDGSTPPHSTAATPGPRQMEAVRSKVPVRGASTVTGPDHAEVAERV